MKNIMFKQSKQILSLLIAFSVLAVSLFTGISINADATTGTTDTWDGSYSQPTATDTDGTTILISTAEELAWVILKSGSAGAGVTYKVADGIKAFYMNENTAELTLSQVKNSLDGNNANTWDYQSNVFQGALDGNGVTIYGLYSKGENNTASSISAFIPYITGTVTVKNIAVKNSYIAGYKYAAALIGSTVGEEGLASLTIENCEISNNYIYQTRTDSSNTGSNYSASAICGSIVARAVPCYVTINNCAVYENELYSALGGNISGTIAYFYPKSDNATNGYFKFTNLLISGVAPWCGSNSYHGRRDINFQNVYTDTDASNFVENTGNVSGTIASAPCDFIEGKITLVDTANMQGTAAQTNMPNLDWTNTWVTVNDNYATLRLFYTEETTDDNEQPQKNIIYWDGTSTAPDESKTDADGNILIHNAAELHYIAIELGTDNSTGKTYKIADGIDVMILQPKASVDADTLMGLTDYNAVKTYLTETVSEPKNWLDGVNDSVRFNGSFDGNGVEIYGLYATGASVGLFPCGDGGTAYTTDGHTGCVYQNFAVRNSYLESSRRLGVIAAYCTSSSAIGIGTVTAKNCEVSNCYIISTATTASHFAEAGVLIGRTNQELVKIDNCLVYGNYSYATGLQKQIPLYPCAYTGDSNALSTVENSVILGTTPYPTNATSSKTHSVNSFENVYTDQELSTYATYADTDMKQIALDDIKGASAKTQMPNLDWTNTWITVDGKYPALRAFYDGADDGDDSGNTGDGGDDTTSTANDTWDGTVATAFESGTGTKADPFIIKTAEQLAYLASGANGTTGGNYYKVADGIEAFDMCGFEGITLDSTLADVKTATKTGQDWSATYNETNAFCGVFDGNEVTVYNLYGKKSSMGLFPCVKGYDNSAAENVTIKNITVKNSYFEATSSGYGNGAGGIFGKHTNSGSAYPLTIEKCAVENCYIANTNTSAESYAGAIGGTVRWATAIIDNCLVADNEIVGGTVSKGGLVAVAQNTSAITASNCVIIGTTPYPTGTQGTITSTNFTDLIAPTSYTNIYTDQTVDSTYTGITTLTAAQMTGETAVTNMTGLDWGSNWKTRENYYPTPFTPVVTEGVWNGEEAADYAGGDGTEENPFIIENVAQLYKMVKDGGEDASGNAAYFKVKDGVYDLYANPVEGMTSDEVKAYFADPTTYKAVWDPQTTEFNGTFDGNGVNIHGLYNVKAATGAGVAFLPRVSNSKAFINNVQFSDCYFENTGSYASGTSAAVLVGRSDNSDISFNNVAVCNSTAKCAAHVAAVFVAQNGATVTIDTAFTSGNTLYSEYYYSESLTYTYEGILYGNTSGYLYTIKNSVFTETDEYMSRVHYNVSIKFENSYVAALTASSITGISVSEISQSSMIGSSAQTNMPDLDWTTWILTDSYPVIAALHDLAYTATGDNGHTVTCGDCDVSISLESHNYNSNYVCTLCAFEHSHTLVDSGIDYDATCVDSGVMNVKCEYCDYTSTREICAKNHIFGEVIAATAGDCQTEATVAYKTCSQCELCFTSDADITSTNPLDHIGTGYTARHDWVAQTPISSVCSSIGNLEYFECSVCGIFLVEGIMTDNPPSDIDGHAASSNYFISENSHANICILCGETFNSQEHSDTDNDSVCDICGWPCGEHIFEGASITLSDSIAVNYKIKKSVIDVLGYSNLYIKFTFCDKDYVVDTYTPDGDYYVFTFDNIAPDRMNDAIYATLYGTKGDTTYQSETCEYSVKKYCYNMLEKYSNDQSFRTLLVDLLEYGEKSQLYTGYNTENLVTSDLTDEQKTYATQTTPVLNSVQNLEYSTIAEPSANWKGAGLFLNDSITLRFTIQTENIDNLTVKVSTSGKTWYITADEFVSLGDNKYYIYFNGLGAHQMKEALYLTVYNGSDAVSNTIRYSIESYAKSMSEKGDEPLNDLLIAMIKYGDSANVYANGQ